jgi:NAD(P)-dependent dehydrogenase (short-subunit alcohol dehydrogenase family)
MQRGVERPPALQAFIEGCIAAPPAGLGEPMDIAGVTVFLASKLSSYVVGHNVIVDGGLTLTTARPDIGMGAKPKVLEEMEQGAATS